MHHNFIPTDISVQSLATSLKTSARIQLIFVAGGSVRSKLSDWEGGVKVTAFVSGGWVEGHGQSGTKRSGLVAIAE